MKEQMLKQVALFASLPGNEVKYLAEILHYREFSAGTVFIQESEIADHFFILLEGQIHDRGAENRHESGQARDGKRQRIAFPQIVRYAWHGPSRAFLLFEFTPGLTLPEA